MNCFLLFFKCVIIISNYGLGQEGDWDFRYFLKNVRKYDDIFNPINPVSEVVIYSREYGSVKEYKFEGLSTIVFQGLLPSNSATILVGVFVRIEITEPENDYVTYLLCEFENYDQAESFFSDIRPNPQNGELMFNVGKLTEGFIPEGKDLADRETEIAQRASVYKLNPHLGFSQISFFVRPQPLDEPPGRTLMYFQSKSFDMGRLDNIIHFMFDGINNKVYDMEFESENIASIIFDMMSVHENSE